MEFVLKDESSVRVVEGTHPLPDAAPTAGSANATQRRNRGPSSEFVTLDGEPYSLISAVDALPPFLMNIPTDTDLWMFISSNGGLTAGRHDPDGALFPYETVDKLHDATHHTGPITLLRWHRGNDVPRLWEPLAPVDIEGQPLARSLAKNTLGNRLAFEEVHHEARLAFRYRWAGSDATGWVRTASLANLGLEPVTIHLLDGLRNVLPSGAPLRLYQQSSCLVDAYKRVDVDPATRLGIFSLTARITDRPEPAEELRATTVWCHGLPGFQVTLSGDAIRSFRRGQAIGSEHLLTGRRGNYLVESTLTIEPGARVEWHIAADTARSHTQIASLRAGLRDPGGLGAWVTESLQEASNDLRRIVASADGLQLTGCTDAAAHHLANVLFNNLRGGVFVHNHAFPRADFSAFLRSRDRGLAARHVALVEQLPDEPTVMDLHRAAESTGDAGLRRLCYEYLPLYFGRRHGDPSRPWNRFSISVRNPDGTKALRYEGNWRDVFQNWEALTLSFPGFLPSVIAKFVNASTVDGFNPYRMTRDGVDWEVLDPRDPWSGIGYWGDHQIVYLLRLLESMRRHVPGGIEQLLGQEIFSYADVPYRIKPYAEMLDDPSATIAFDESQEARVAERVAARGFDGKLVHTAGGAVHHVSLLEKLIVPALAKLSCFVPGGGIWMNTERPEWNDANNALAGHGLSVVTLCYLRRYLSFLERLLAEGSRPAVAVSVEVVSWLRQVAVILRRHDGMHEGGGADEATRRQVMDELGRAYSAYREQVYSHGFSAKTPLEPSEVVAWCRNARAHVDHTLRANRRGDGLYESYNMLDLGTDGSRAAIQPLGIMLEGQVAALSSGLMKPSEATDVIDALFASPLFHRERNTFLLYPDRALPAFLERNRIPEAGAATVPLVAELLAAGDTSIVERDVDGVLRFNPDFSNARDVTAALDQLERREPWTRSARRDRQPLLELFVDVFRHRTFTGRSGTMYAYEGIGSVYWHMVAKLLLAVEEMSRTASENGEAADVRARLARDYYRIRGGLGYERHVRDYGAFPTDPYSHTPAHAGAQQPGMTGQVKEEILTRFGELGVRVRHELVGFDPLLLMRDEFLAQPASFDYVDLEGASQSLDVPAGSLAFTYCQVPVVYSLTAGAASVRVVTEDRVDTEHDGCWLTPADSRRLLSRLGGIARIEIAVPERAIIAS